MYEKERYCGLKINPTPAQVMNHVTTELLVNGRGGGGGDGGWARAEWVGDEKRGRTLVGVNGWT